jgi:hypothetical protein
VDLQQEPPKAQHTSKMSLQPSFTPAQRLAGQQAAARRQREERAAFEALPLRQRIPSQIIKTSATKAEWEAVMAELDTLDHPQMRAHWEKEWAKIIPCAGGYEQRTQEIQILSTTRTTLLWVHSEAKRIAGELLHAELPGEKAPDVSGFSAAFIALVAVEMEPLRAARDAKDAAAVADVALVEKEAQARVAPHPPRGGQAPPKRPPHTPLKIGPLFEAAVMARVAELRAEAAAARKEHERRLEEVRIESEALRRVAAIKKEAEQQLHEERVRAKMAELLASSSTQDARTTARMAELSGLF